MTQATVAGLVRRPSIVLLGLLTAVDAMAIDIYIPALPVIQAHFHADASGVQVTLAVFLIGIAAGQAFWGPLTDRFGRRGPLLIGLVAYIAGSLLSAVAPTLAMLILGRFIQAIGASAGLVIARAIVNDLWPADAAARLYSTMMQILGVTAAISPLIGSGLLVVGSWQSIFLVLAVVGCGCLIWTVADVSESLPKDVRSEWTGASSLWTGYAVLLRTPAFLWAASASAFTMGAMFALLAGGSFVFVSQFGWSTTAYGVFYAITSAFFIAACQLNNRLLRRFSPRKLMRSGLVLQLSLAALMLAVVACGILNDLVLAALMTVLIGGLGLILGNAVSEAMRAAPRQIAGTASAVVGIGQFAVSALMMPLATIIPNIALSVSAVTFACAVLAWVSGFKSGPAATR